MHIVSGCLEQFGDKCAARVSLQGSRIADSYHGARYTLRCFRFVFINSIGVIHSNAVFSEVCDRRVGDIRA